ncbi:dihydroorotase [Zavarzinia sp. CC-PAN008]|uniref:dihydroorotase n=1 Tax=Zavarzinia sp. CC-PAN008 TaxID=3243332 RepID=UPI003F749045
MTAPAPADGRRIAYVNARLLDPATRLDAPGALLTQGGEILDAGPRLFADGIPADVAVIDCGGDCLAPGLIDMRVFIGEPGAEHMETIESASKAAAAGGITTMIMMPNTEPPIDEPALVDYVERRARVTSDVRVHAMAGITKGLAGKEMAEMGLLKAAGAVAFTDGRHAVADALVLRRALSYATGFGMLVVQHAEEPRLSTGAMNEGEVATRLGLPGIPAAAEAIQIERDVRLVALTGARYHVAQVSCADSLEVIRGAKERGLAVTCGVSPHHFALNETAVAEYRTFAKTSPPLRAEADRLAIVEGLRDGTIDVISSSHDPQDQESKRQPFAQAASGVIGLETMLPIALELHLNGYLSLLDLLARMTINPARLLGLNRGVLKAGAKADFFVFDPEAPWIIRAEKLRSKSKNSPYDGRPIQGRVRRTVVAGRTVFGG